tara:strand:- start:84 stop:323 length:240 start_codon:yes stop_codon:yes gene_type:complete
MTFFEDGRVEQLDFRDSSTYEFTWEASGDKVFMQAPGTDGVHYDVVINKSDQQTWTANYQFLDIDSVLTDAYRALRLTR